MAAVTGREAAAGWLTRNSPSLTAMTTHGEAARSADLGYSYGTYQKPGTTTRGPYVRIWSRNPAGDWLIVVDAMPTAR
ncbi:MAG: hypothetical protein ABIP65_02290 [Vicinamibacterales bacterium]